MKHLLIIFILMTSIGTAAKAVTKADVIANISNNVILRTYQDFAQNSINLKSAIETFIATANQKNLEAAQNAWRASRLSYEVSEGFLFGPMDALGIDPMIDTWPLNLKDLRAILASNAPITIDFVRSLGASVQGFHTIEFLLFGEGIVTNTKDLSLFTPRQMDYLSVAAELLAEQTDTLLLAWTTHYNPEDPSTGPYIDVIGKPGVNNQHYSTESAVIQEFVNGMINIVSEAGKAKLPDAAGTDPENANARLEESPFSWNSITDFTSNINSVLNIYTGFYNGRSGAGIKDLVAANDSTLADRVEAEMINCRQLIQDVSGANNISFGHAIKDPAGRVRIFAAIKALVHLQQTLETEVVPAIGN